MEAFHVETKGFPPEHFFSRWAAASVLIEKTTCPTTGSQVVGEEIWLISFYPDDNLIWDRQKLPDLKTTVKTKKGIRETKLKEVMTESVS